MVDNKGQHSINMAAQAAVIAARGKLGFNAKWIIEMGEETGSPGLKQLCREHKALLAADLLIASDGPRLSAERPTVFLGARGAIAFASTDGHIGVISPDGAVETIGDAFCSKGTKSGVAGLTPVTGGGLAVVCDSGTVALLSGSGIVHP